MTTQGGMCLRLHGRPPIGDATAPRERSGLVLLAVLTVIVILSLSAYSFAYWMRLEAKAAEVAVRTVQARLFAESGVELVRAMVMYEQHGLPVPDLTDNPELLQGIALFDAQEDVHPRLRGQFSVLAPAVEASALGMEPLIRFGVTDEAAKLDLNAWAERDPARLRQALTESFLVPQETAANIVDWIGRAGATGGPLDFSLTPWTAMNAYRPKHAPLESIDELLAVRSVTRELLYGAEERSERSIGALAAMAQARLVPLAGRVTIYGRASETDHLGRPRIWLNNPNLSELYRQVQSEFGEPLARFVIGFRVFGPGATSTAEPALPQGAGDASVGRHEFRSIVDLLDGRASGTWGKHAVAIASPISRSSGELPKQLARLLDRFTVSAGPVRSGVINIHTAPEEVLAILPRLTANERRAIVAHRAESPSYARRTTWQGRSRAWLVAEGGISLDAYREIEALITDRSEVFSVRVLGYLADRGPWVQIEAVVDGTRRPPEVIFHQESVGAPDRRTRDAIWRDSRPRTLRELDQITAGSLSAWPVEESL